MGDYIHHPPASTIIMEDEDGSEEDTESDEPTNNRANRPSLLQQYIQQDAIDIDTGTDLPHSDSPLPPVVFRMPNTAFGISMGLAGHAIMWSMARTSGFVNNTTALAAFEICNSVAWYSALMVWVVVSFSYVYKCCASFLLVVDEFKHEVRVHFFNTPNLTLIMLTMGVPSHIQVSLQTQRIIWTISFCFQVLLTQHVYRVWMFSKRRNFTEARPQFLLSTVGWFLLANLGYQSQVREAFGIGLPQMCFGAGIILYIEIVIFIFGKLHENEILKGAPAMFLLIAPPSVGVVSLDLFDEGASDFSLAGEMLLGYVYVLLGLLITSGPILSSKPTVLGGYWAYVFPTAAATTATIRYASRLETESTMVLAIVLITFSVLTAIVVLGRMLLFICQCIMGKDNWADPLFDKEKYSQKLC